MAKKIFNFGERLALYNDLIYKPENNYIIDATSVLDWETIIANAHLEEYVEIEDTTLLASLNAIISNEQYKHKLNDLVVILKLAGSTHTPDSMILTSASILDDSSYSDADGYGNDRLTIHFIGGEQKRLYHFAFIYGDVGYGDTTWYYCCTKYYDTRDIDFELHQVRTQYNIMPTASLNYWNYIVQYVGPTNQNYTNGYFYKCVSDGQNPATYSWEVISVQTQGTPFYLGNTTDYTAQNPLDISVLEPGLYAFNVTSTNDSIYVNGKVNNISFTGSLNVGTNDSSYNSNYIAYLKITTKISTCIPTTSGIGVGVIYYNTTRPSSETITYWTKSLKVATNSAGTAISIDSSSASVFTLKVVTQNDNQTITGRKTFSTLPETSVVPTQDYHIVNKKYVDDQDKIILNNIAPQYSTSSTYNEGDHVIHNGVLYECNTTISVAEAWTPAHWTQKEILSYIDNKISNIDITKREIVQTLPTQDIATDTIYMVPSSTPGTQNVYNEYMYINNAWELIGNTAIDLSNYYTKSEVDAMITNINNQIGNIAEVLSHLTDPVIPIGTVLYTENVTRTVGNVTYEGTYTATLKEFHADTNYYVIDYTFENTGADDIPGAVFDEITVDPAGHLPLMAAYTIEAGETVTLTSYWQDSATYAATEARYQVPGNVSVEFDTTDNTTNYTSNLALNKLDGFNTDVVAHVHTYDSSEIDEGWTHTTFDRTGGTEDPYTVPEPFYVAWINFDTQTFGVLSESISGTLTMTRSYIGFNADQFDQNNVAFFLAKTADVADCTWQEFEDAYYDYTGGVN